jgi:hypothetical protein
MPRVRLIDPMGMCYGIDTRSPYLLKRWFDEILPNAFVSGRPGVDDFEVVWPRVDVSPMWVEPRTGPPVNPDWLVDSRVLGRMEELRAKNGDDGMAELQRIRAALEQELRTYNARRRRTDCGRTSPVVSPAKDIS